jgi:hypothetical protein
MESTAAGASEAEEPPAAPNPPAGDATGAAKPRRPMPTVVSGRRSYRRVRGTMHVGSVLGRTFTVFGKNALAFSLISLVVHLPLAAYTWWTWDVSAPRTPEESQALLTRLGWWVAANLIGGLLLGHIAAGPVTYGVVQRLRGGRPSLGACIGQGFRRLPRVLGVGALLTLYFFVVLVLLVFLLVHAVGTMFGASEVGQVVAALALAFPFLSILSVFWVAVPVAVTEEKGSKGAMGRSAQLTGGNFWKVFAVLAVLYVGEQIAARLVATAMGDARDFGDLKSLNLMPVGLSAVLFGPLRAVASAIGYHDLRTSSEGIDSEQLARVFD